MPVDFDKIKRRRIELMLNEYEAADRAGFKGPRGNMRWNDIETGKNGDLRLSTLEAIAKALGLHVCDLIVNSAGFRTEEPDTAI